MRGRGEFKFEFAQRHNAAFVFARGRGARAGESARPTCSRAAAQVAKHSIREPILTTNNTATRLKLMETIS